MVAVVLREAFIQKSPFHPLQNRACKYYKLTSDNDGEAFQTQCGRQEDLVTSTMKKMVGPEAE